MADEPVSAKPEEEATGPEPAANVDDNNDALTTAQQRAQRAEMALWRERAAMSAGIPTELAERLTGDSEDALKEDAAKLAQILQNARGPSMHTRPKPTVGAGASKPANDANEANGDRAAELAKAIRARMSA